MCQECKKVDVAGVQEDRCGWPLVCRRIVVLGVQRIVVSGVQEDSCVRSAGG